MAQIHKHARTPRAVGRARFVLGLTAAGVAGTAALLGTGSAAQASSVNWDAVAQCESGGNWSTNTGNGAYGGLQFKPATWASNGGVGNPATAPRSEQIRVAENVLLTQGIKAWPKCGANAGSPAVWGTPTMPSVTTGCAAMPASGLFGFINPRQMCSALLSPLGV